ncbi:MULTISPECIES: hypothetical protein [unclassified Mesobacillus]|uniref:hypothetical protein n=1 Tax=unclassified Mesobacillus TaxID=2675270 RepID=UPI00203A727E|nr:MULTISPECIES: hypothetical protein [unclassified Mesobacillus]MCM3125838.1 hypothetical protein [Mesobacillus sp. MER 33]MCM3235859.1 hypothetical protein [Mesobacillus sp. MER 48]
MNTSISIKTKTLISERQQIAYGLILLIVWITTLINFILYFPELLHGISLSMVIFLFFHLFNIRIHEYSHHYAGKIVRINSTVLLKEKICIPKGINHKNNLILMALGPIIVETFIFFIIFWANPLPSFLYLLQCLFGWQGDIYLIYMLVKTRGNTYFSFDVNQKQFLSKI